MNRAVERVGTVLIGTPHADLLRIVFEGARRGKLLGKERSTSRRPGFALVLMINAISLTSTSHFA